MKLKMAIYKDDYALEWSFVQKCFHIERLSEAIKCNLHSFLSGGYTDYALLGIFHTDEEASAAAQFLREKRPDIFNGQHD